MNLRTITFWVLYNPKRREVVALSKSKKDLLPKPGSGSVVVKVKGHYLPPRNRADRGAEK